MTKIIRIPASQVRRGDELLSPITMLITRIRDFGGDDKRRMMYGLGTARPTFHPTTILKIRRTT